RNWTMLLVGVIASAALAVVLDLLLGAAEHALAGRKRGRVIFPAVGLAALILVVIVVLPRIVSVSASVSVSGRRSLTLTHTPTPTRRSPLKIGAKTFTEQYILAEVLRARLAASGIDSEVAGSLGSTVIFDALVDGDVDVYVDY